MNVSMFEDKIAFHFEEETVNGGFVSKTDFGLYIQEDHSKQVGQARWGKVIKVGPDCTEVKVGDTILIEPVMWTNGVSLDEGKEFWVTRESNVIGLRE